MIRFPLPLLIACMLLLGGMIIHAESESDPKPEVTRKQLPTKAISYSPILSKTRFDERFPGTPLAASEFPAAEGTYIVYQHGRITYFFGPAASRDVAQRYLEYLNTVVAQVQQKRDHLKSAKTYLLQLPQEQTGGSETQKNQSDQASEPEPKKNQTPNSPTEPWWKTLIPLVGQLIKVSPSVWPPSLM